MKQLRTINPNEIDRVRRGDFTDSEKATLFVDADLTGVDLSNCNLSHFNFSNAQLFKVNFANSELFGAILNEADATGANFESANLSDTKLIRTGLGHGSFVRANMFNADFSGSTLTGANLTEADCRSSKFVGSRFRDSILNGADFTSADLQDVDFTNSEIIKTEFREANLQKSQLRNLNGFRDANWIGVDIRGVNFSGAYRIRREIMDQNYLHEFRNQGKLFEFYYQMWLFTSDCGRSMRRWGSLIVIQMVIFAFLYNFVAIDFGDYPTFLSPLYHSVVTMTTLGYGDTLPMSATAQIVVMIQVTLSYAMLGGLMALLTNKLARRAE